MCSRHACRGGDARFKHRLDQTWYCHGCARRINEANPMAYPLVVLGTYSLAQAKELGIGILEQSGIDGRDDEAVAALVAHLLTSFKVQEAVRQASNDVFLRNWRP